MMGVITVRLLGGLGNQMFQYAAGRALAEKHRAELQLDTSGYDRDMLRTFALGSMRIGASIVHEQPTSIVYADPLAKLARRMRLHGLLRRIRSQGSPPARVFRERSFSYDERFWEQKPPVVLDGYWQSEKYFSSVATLLRQELSIREGFGAQDEAIAAQIRECNSVSLHVRRGDYVSNPVTQSVHGSCSVSYYLSAAAYIAERVDRPHFYIFSDDPDWAEENLALGHPVTLVRRSANEDPARDVMLMRLCNHHVIANSSFSWWGAWLNPSPLKLVIAPKRWFNEADHDTSDLIPPDWVQI